MPGVVTCSSSVMPVARILPSPTSSIQRWGSPNGACGGNGTYTTTEKITAVEVNGQPIATYLNGLCTAAEPQAVATGPVTDFVPLYIEPTTLAENTATEVIDSLIETTPPATYAALAAAVAAAEPHRVAAGETLYRISQRYDIAVNTLKSINGLATNTIYVGQELLLEANPEPIPAAAVASERIPNSPVSSPTPPVSGAVLSADYHVVQPGENHC